MEISTRDLPAKDGLSYWSSVLKRMEVDAAAPTGKRFLARLRRLSGRNGEFWDHYSDTLHVNRTRVRCARDGGDEIYVGLMMDGDSNLSRGDRRVALRTGDIYVVDFSRPVRAEWMAHRELGLVIDRRHVSAALGSAADVAAVFKARSGVAALFASHLRVLASEASRLSDIERIEAIEVAIQLALILLRAGPAAPEKLDGAALIAIARRLIAERLSEPELTADDIAKALGCSRATLYRHFEREGAGVVETIRDLRLDAARDRLAAEPSSRINDLAFRCGFLDQSSFNRMFKRRFGVTPGEFRAASTDVQRGGRG
jgi:AraC-like DNA-binding protein